jgi:hypothetical protein
LLTENQAFIRTFKLRDTPLVARLERLGTALDTEEQLTHPRSALHSALLDKLLSPRAGPSTFILDHHDEHGKHLGMAQVRLRPERQERDIVFISPTLDTNNSSKTIWQRLLTHLCVQMAEQGNLRIYAHLPMESEALCLFKLLGFLEYSQEEIYRLAPGRKHLPLKTSLTLRPQEASDGWGLQKLYTAQTPRQVQNAEGLAQGKWALPRRRWSSQGRRQGYVWEEEGELLGALHIRAGSRGYWIQTLLHPDALEQAEPLCRAALDLIGPAPRLPIYFAWRQYEAGWQNVLPVVGFEPFTCQALVVKHMAVRVRETTPMLIPTLTQEPHKGAAPTVITQAEVVEPEPNGRHNIFMGL